MAVRRPKNGFVLIVTCVALTILLAFAALGIDIARMYVIQSELQAFTDAAALGAAMQLDGGAEGIGRAHKAATQLAIGPHAMKWDLGTKAISEIAESFAEGSETPDPKTWAADPKDAARLPFCPRDGERARTAGLSANLSAARCFHRRGIQRGDENIGRREVDGMKRRNRQAGSALIELAGSMILLMTLLTGIFQTGYTFYTYENLVHAVRAGARYASLGVRGSSNDSEFATSVRNLVVYGDPQARGGKPIVPGLAPEQVEVVA